MIKVTIELLSALTGRTTKLGTTYITNDGKGTKELRNYDVRVMRKGVENPMGRTAREGRIEKFPSERVNVWCLVTRALLAAFPEERKSARHAETQVNATVMQGLNMLAEYAPPLEDTPVKAAREWLAASEGQAEPDVDATSRAMGCDMPEGDAREQLQRRVFLGLHLLGRHFTEDGHEWTSEQMEAVTTALKFIEALPS